MALPILVDGAALDATSFGEEDDDGYWNPIEFTGTTTQKQPDLTGSSNIGNMTGGGGLAAAFDGTTSQANTAGAALNNSSSDGTVGKDWGSGNTKTINKAVIIGPNNTSIVRNSIDSQGGTTVYLEASTDNFSASTVSLASASTSTDSGEVIVLETSGASAYRYHRIRVQAIDGSSDCFIAEVQFYEDTNSSYGTNGFELDYADSGYFGKDVNGTYPAIGATWRGSYSSDSDDTSYTNSAAALGTADADRYVVVAIPIYQGTSNITISSVTVGGVSATKIHGETFDSGGGNRSLVDYWKVNVPTGTTGDIVITPSGTAPRMSFSWWTCIGDVQIMDKQVHKAVSTGTENVLTVTLQRPDNGFVLAAVTSQGDAGDPTYTWGGTGITERYETGYGDQDASHGSASGDFTSAERSAVTVTNGLGNQYYYILSAVAFVPAGDNSLVASGFTADDQLSDTPTDDADLGIGNFATLNPNDNGGGTLSQGNRYFSSGSDKSIRATMSGTEKYQIEFFGYNELMFGLASAACALTGGNHYSDANSFMYYGYNGNKVNTTFTSYGSAFTTDSTYVGMTYDPSNGDLRFYLNGTDQGTAFTMDTNVEWYPYIFLGAGNQYGLMNFGQTAFEYPISGFTPLATQNFPAPTIADGSDYFNTVLYTGNGTAIASGKRNITGVGFQPDFVWINQGRDSLTIMQATRLGSRCD
jgi:hypothetical protein